MYIYIYKYTGIVRVISFESIAGVIYGDSKGIGVALRKIHSFLVKMAFCLSDPLPELTLNPYKRPYTNYCQSN